MVRGGRRSDARSGSILCEDRRVTASEVWTRIQAQLTPEVVAVATAHDLADRLAVGLQAIRERWPGSPAIGDGFIAYLAQRLASQPDLDGALPRLRIDDLFLAWWAGSGDPHGIIAFEAALAEDLRRVASRFRHIPADELRQVLRIKLFVGDGKTPPRIRSYAGFGFLQNWLRITAARTFVDAARADQGRHYAEELDEHEVLQWIPPTGDPRDHHQRNELAVAIKHAFGIAVAGLAPRERTFLRHASVDRLTLDQIAATYRVHRATVARVLAAARERLLQQTRAGVVAALGIEPTELASAMHTLDHRLDLSLSRVLRED